MSVCLPLNKTWQDLTLITHSKHSNHMTSQSCYALRESFALFFLSISKNKTPPAFPPNSFFLEKTTGKTHDRSLCCFVSCLDTAQWTFTHLNLQGCPKVHYMDKSATPLYLWIKVFCKFHCNKCITSSTYPCSLPLQKNVKECLVLKSSLNSSVPL